MKSDRLRTGASLPHKAMQEHHTAVQHRIKDSSVLVCERVLTLAPGPSLTAGKLQKDYTQITLIFPFYH